MLEKKRILIVDDDTEIRDLLEFDIITRRVVILMTKKQTFVVILLLFIIIFTLLYR